MANPFSPTASSIAAVTNSRWQGNYGVLTTPAVGAVAPPMNALDYDSFVDFKINESSALSNFAVEDGAFATYNQAQHPYKVTVRLAVVGNSEKRQKFLTDLQTLKEGIDLVMIATPDKVYPNAKLVSYDYARQANHNAWGRVVADLHFEEVRIVNVQYTTVKSPGAVKKVSTGKVPPTPRAIQVNKVTGRR